MKKIKNIEQLQVEKLRLILERKRLEQQMHVNLQELKESARPVNLLKDTIGSTINKAMSENGAGFRKGLLLYGAGLLARKFAGKIAERFFRRS
jgi:hypothetical protein